MVAEPLIPPADEAWRYAVGPSSVSWRYGSDSRAMFAAGAALLMQVAHPVVAGGVREFSDYKADPFGRLWRTLDYVNLLVYGGADVAAATGRAMRAMHKRFKGVDPAGRRYNALDPEPYAWVHATLAYGIVNAHAQFGRRMSPQLVEQFWREWRGLGRLLGIRERDLPADWSGFTRYVDWMVAERLEDNDVVRDVLFSIEHPVPSPVSWIGPRAWRLALAPANHVLSLATVALIPDGLRTTLDLQPSALQTAQVRALGTASRATTPLLPPALRRFGPLYLKRRHHAISRGGFGAALGERPPAPARRAAA